MDYLEVIDQKSTIALVDKLSEACGVRKPKISFAGRKQERGRYFSRKRTIMLHRQTVVCIVVHEFAHYLDHVETGRNIAKQSNDKEWHSQGFYYKLRKVTRLLGGEYPWDREYKQIARWAAAEKKLDIPSQL
jgi:predicted SprT family Zn-dependent metalloprotease